MHIILTVICCSCHITWANGHHLTSEPILLHLELHQGWHVAALNSFLCDAERKTWILNISLLLFFSLTCRKEKQKALIAHVTVYDTTEWSEWACLQSLLLKIKLKSDCLSVSIPCVCFDINASRQPTSPCVSKPVFSPEGELWILGPVNGKKNI